MLRRFVLSALFTSTLLAAPNALAAKKKKTTKSTATTKRPRARARYSSRPTKRQSDRNQQRRDARRQRRRQEKNLDNALQQAAQNAARNAGLRVPRSVKVAKANQRLAKGNTNARTPSGKQLRFKSDVSVRYFDKTKPANQSVQPGAPSSGRASVELRRLQRDPKTGVLSPPPGGL